MQEAGNELQSLKERIQELVKENAGLKDELVDLKILNENTMEHSSTLEDELVDQNLRMDLLQKKMKKYLSPQLYEALLGGEADATLVNKRKLLTVFFSDIVGFTDMTDSMESELISEILNSYLNRMADIAIKWGGTIDKFIGDAVMVFFGDPEVIDDQTHAKNCVSMALEMLDELDKLAESWRKKGFTATLQIRIGINTGYCTVGNFGSESRMDYTIIGGSVNAASRLESLAKPNSIYVSGATCNLVKDFFLAESIGNVQVKGIHHPIEVYEIKGYLNQEQEKKLDEKKDYIRITKEGFVINNMVYNMSGSGANDKSRMLSSLKSAVKILEGSSPEGKKDN